MICENIQQSSAFQCLKNVNYVTILFCTNNNRRYSSRRNNQIMHLIYYCFYAKSVKIINVTFTRLKLCKRKKGNTITQNNIPTTFSKKKDDYTISTDVVNHNQI